MRHYCTLFDHSYLSRGLALYESLMRYEKDMMLYILAMDEICYRKLESLKLERVRLICCEEFEDEELRKKKSERTWAEYCWTCSSVLIEYVLCKYQVDMCIYLDSDIFFFGSPAEIFSEMGHASVLITPHNFAAYCDLTKNSGRYCVQFIPFVNDENGRKVLADWKEKCLECCKIEVQKGHCGDQKYLDDWPQIFEGVYETANLGVGVAPWNVARFQLNKRGENLFVYEKELKTEYPFIFYHYHGLKFYDNDIVRLTHKTYDIDSDVVREVYTVYFRAIQEVHRKYMLNDGYDYDGTEHDEKLDIERLGKNYYKLSKVL